MKHVKRFPRWVISAVFFGLVLVFLVLYLRTIDWDTMRSLSINWTYLAVAAAIGTAFLYLGAYVWRVILRALGANQLPSYATTTKVYARAWMGRYIPGTVTWIAAKVILASGWGISKSRLSVASLLEGGSQVLAFTCLGFLLLGFDPRLDVVPTSAKIGLIILGLAVLAVLLPPIFNRVLAALFRMRGKTLPSDELRINSKAVARSFGLYMLGGIVYGTASFFVVLSVAPDLAFSNLPYVIGAFALATVAGMAAPFAPSGIGIKDGLQLVFLAAILPNEIALAATVLIRLWSVLIDLFFLGLSHLPTNRKHLTVNA